MSEPVTVPVGNSSSSEVPGPAAGKIPGRRVLFPLLIATNGAAAWGQSYWLHDNVTGAEWSTYVRWTIAIAVALVLELLGVFLAQMADQAEERRLPAGGIRTMSYAVGLFIGCLNFSHWLTTAVAAAVIFGFLSSISPFAWGIYARVRRARRDAPSRWLWHPIKSISLTRYAAWEGIADPEQARMAYEMLRNSDGDPRPVSGPRERTKEEIGMAALDIRSKNPAMSWERIAAGLGITPSYLYQCRRHVGEGMHG
jgi:hypothetical protein